MYMLVHILTNRLLWRVHRRYIIDPFLRSLKALARSLHLGITSSECGLASISKDCLDTETCL
jgi:hypothetical protein